MSNTAEQSTVATSRAMLERARQEGVPTAWDRLASQGAQCKFGREGVCCRICVMGPCRITPKSPFGVCGATASTIAARNLGRMVAGGAAAHSDHGRAVVHALLLAATDPNSDYKIKDPKKLARMAADMGIEADGKPVEKLAEEVAHAALAQFGQQEGELPLMRRAPEARQKVWRETGVWPRGIDREIVEMMHRTHMGVDADYRNIVLHCIRTSLADGWGGSMLGTDLSDVLFGSPEPLRAKVDLGILKGNKVNLIVHGHEPVLSEMIVEATRDPELLALAKEKGAEGIQVAGICCTANEILMRHGIPIAGNFLQQELAVMTGAVELMVVDVQCIMQGLTRVCDCFHTKLVSTSDRARIEGVEHISFDERRALRIAKDIVRMAVENFPNRDPQRVQVPDGQMDLVAGFTAEYVFRLLGGTFRPSYRPLNNGIIEGRLRGVAGVVGCENPKIAEASAHLAMVKELIRNDVLVLSTGCSAIASAREGLLTPESSFEHAGLGLQEICEAVGIPPVLHVGSCVDNSRILIAACEIIREGGLGQDLSDIPAAGAAPEWMSEKAVSIGMYFVGSGVFTVFGQALPVLGSEELTKYLTEDLEGIVGGKWAFESDPITAARMMIDHIDKKRAALKLRPMMYEQPYQMAAG
jgi:carbon-monoxide dehydrogenase catalytic subunit